MKNGVERKATGPLRTFEFSAEADAELLKRKAETGKTMKSILEDLLLGRREFAPDLERFIAEEVQRLAPVVTRRQVVEMALLAWMRERQGAQMKRGESEKSAMEKVVAQEGHDEPKGRVIKPHEQKRLKQMRKKIEDKQSKDGKQ